VVSGPRPHTVVLVAGTGTETGKTWVACRLLEAWRAAGHTVAARKPAQSFAPGDGPTDAERLGRASGEPAESVCRAERWYGTPMAPPMAAAALGRPGPTISELCEELAWPDPAVDVGVIEAAGGVRSPLADDGDTVDLAAAVRPDVVMLVADAGLGTINAVRLSMAALHAAAGRGGAGEAPVVVLNRFDWSAELHRRNRAWLDHTDGFDVVAGAEELEAWAGRLSHRWHAPVRA
jgi:dethiobiotin synthetase